MKKLMPVVLVLLFFWLYSAEAENWCANKSDFKNSTFNGSTNAIITTTTLPDELSSSRRKHWQPLAKRIISYLKDTDETLKNDDSIQVHFAQSNLPNAFVNNNNLVTISSGLLESINTSEELTFVIAHELSHIILGHTKKPIDSNINSLILQEIIADKLAIQLMRMSNNPKGSGANLLKRLGDTPLPYNQAKKLLDTHPSIKARLEMLAKND